MSKGLPVANWAASANGNLTEVEYDMLTSAYLGKNKPGAGHSFKGSAWSRAPSAGPWRRTGPVRPNVAVTQASGDMSSVNGYEFSSDDVPVKAQLSRAQKCRIAFIIILVFLAATFLIVLICLILTPPASATDARPATTTCAPGYVGTNCEINLSGCLSSPCVNRATCTPLVDGSFDCQCAPGYTGVTCASVASSCDSHPCGEHGTCTATGNDFTCACDTDYMGYRCDVDLSGCTAGGVCQNGGLCVASTGGGFTCVCDPTATGDRCQTKLDSCQSNPCYNGGECLTTTNGYQCVCTPGFVGRRCLTAVDNCVGVSCYNGGTCISDPLASFTCACAQGFTGPLCQTAIDWCATSPCSQASTCINVAGSYTCLCPPYYYGPSCEVSSPLANTYTFGGSGGSWFNDITIFLANGQMSGVTLWLDTTYCMCIAGIQAIYGPSARGPMHGQANGTMTSVSFGGQFVTEVDVGMNYVGFASGLVCYLAFRTATTSLGPYSIPGCSSATTLTTGSGLAFLAGKSGFYIDVLNFYFYGPVLTAQYGGSGGNAYDDNNDYLNNGPLTGFKIWVSNEVYCIQATYGDTLGKQHGKVSGTGYSLTLNSGEVITSVTVGYGQYVCEVGLSSNTRSFGPYVAYWWNCDVASTATLSFNRLLNIVGRSGDFTDNFGVTYNG